jgi:tetratricopeptide (TPR) repeat protein
VPIDREDTLKKAEKLLRQGRLEAAIAEYLRVVEDQPRDWTTANTLGDLYVRAGQADKAAAQYGRIAEHFMEEGFYPKAGAIFKKLLKLTPDDETAQLNLAEISQRQGLLADAKAQLNAVAARRRARGDRAGAAEIVVRLGSVDPGDVEARTLAARMLVEMGDEEGAAARFRALYDDLAEKGRDAEALQALTEAVKLNPYDRPGRILLAKAAIAGGNAEGARAFLDRETAGDDPTLQMALLEIDLGTRQLDEARELMTPLMAEGPEHRQRLTELAWATAPRNPDAAFVVIDRLVDFMVASTDFADAASLLQEFVTRIPNQIPALLKLVEICVDGGLEATMYEAQAQLADAYLGSGQAAEARVIAEDLVAREPWERAHIDRFRRALVMLKVSDPDSLIAERLSGQAPFTATDVFADSGAAAAAASAATTQDSFSDPAAPEPVEAAEPAAPEPVETQVQESPLELEPAASPAAPQAGAAAEEIDLTNVLGDFGAVTPPAPAPPPAAAAPELEDDLRSEAARQNATDQSAQHMTLARTYLEMGLPDEAIGSLKMASRAPRFRFEAASLLGRLYQQRGDLAAAIEWLERAAEAPAPSEDDSRALLYDLGTLVEESGDTARALAVFLELQSEAGEYRDVAERVERLAKVETGG